LSDYDLPNDPELDPLTVRVADDFPYAKIVKDHLYLLRVRMQKFGISSWVDLASYLKKEQREIENWKAISAPAQIAIERMSQRYALRVSILPAWWLTHDALQLLEVPAVTVDSVDEKYNGLPSYEVGLALLLEAQLRLTNLWQTHPSSFGGEAMAEKMGRAKEMVQKIAQERWGEKGETLRITEMAESILPSININPEALGLDGNLTVAKLKKWLKPIAPPVARKPGRPKKNK
jgi:hypothetical protein